MTTARGLAKAATVIMAATLIGRFVGFIREMVIANQFGATLETDAYVIAYTVPSMVAMALAGAFNAAFLPVFNDYLVNRDKQEAHRLASSILNLVVLFFIIVVGAAFIFSPQIVNLMVNKEFSPEGVTLTVKLFRIILPALLFTGLMGLVSATLNSYKHFLFPAMGPMVTSIVIIGFIITFGAEWGITSLAVGTLVGLGAQFLIQLPVMYKKGFRYTFSLSLNNPGVRRILTLMVPVLLGAVISQSAILVERNLASSLDVGSVSALNYANRVMQLPLGLFVTAISIPLFPALSVYASQKNYAQLKETLLKGINLFLIILIPSMTGLIVLNEPIIKLLFEHGQFTAESTRVTAYALGFYALAILPWAIKDILTRSFYALQDTATPVKIAVFGAFANVVFDFILVKIMGVGGLALGLALGQSVTAIVLYYFLRRKLGSLDFKNWAPVAIKVFAAGLIMALVTFISYGLISEYLPIDSKKVLALNIAISGVLGLVVYFGALLIMKVKEISDLVQIIGQLKAKIGL